MTFTKQDAITFLVGLGAALLVTLAQSLIDTQSLTEDPSRWAISLGTGLLAAAGRYLITVLAQRGVSGGN